MAGNAQSGRCSSLRRHGSLAERPCADVGRNPRHRVKDSRRLSNRITFRCDFPRDRPMPHFYDFLTFVRFVVFSIGASPKLASMHPFFEWSIYFFGGRRVLDYLEFQVTMYDNSRPRSRPTAAVPRSIPEIASAVKLSEWRVGTVFDDFCAVAWL